MRKVHFKHKLIGLSVAFGKTYENKFSINFLIPFNTFIFIKEN